MWIKGKDLTPEQRLRVLSAFVYRWTKDNPHREQVWRGLGQPRIPLLTDRQWLENYEFSITKAGHLGLNRHARPILPPPHPVLKAVDYTKRCLSEI